MGKDTRDSGIDIIGDVPGERTSASSTRPGKI